MYTTSDFRIFNLTHPRWKHIQVITINQDHIWINLNNLCETCRTTTTSALNSIIAFPEYLCYIKQNPQEKEFFPFITEEGFLVAQMGRSAAYKRQILDWIDNEIMEVNLPSSKQMIVLNAINKPQPTINTPTIQKPKTNVPLNYPCPLLPIDEIDPQYNESLAENNEHLDDRISFYDRYCNITKLCHKFNEKGIDYTPQEFRQWLIIHCYISHAKAHLYRPLDRWYDKGYFYDNRKTFNPFYPQRDLIFTPKGQEYFFKKLAQQK